MTTHAQIARAGTHLAAGEADEALRLLLAAWREHRSDRLAALVERTSDLAATLRPKVPGATTKERLTAALELLKNGDPVDVPRVIRSLADVKIAEATVLAGALAKLPADPRFLREIISLLRAPPWGSSTSRTLWKILFEALVGHGDPRTGGQLRAIDFGPIVQSDWGTQQMNASVAKVLKALTVRAPDDAGPIAAACDAVEAIVQRRARQGDALLERIYANPDDRDLRGIYADWLQERGDPRGEFIAIQLAPTPTAAQRKRERELLSLHGRQWLGSIAPACKDRLRFTAGFVSDVTVDTARALTLLEAPEWATVETLWLYSATPEAFPRALVRHPGMVALKRVRGIGPGQLEEIADDPEVWAIEGLGISMPDFRDKFSKSDIAVVSRLRNLPALRELAFEGASPEDHRWLWSTSIGARVKRLCVTSGLVSVPKWIAQPVPAHVISIEVSSNHGWHAWSVELTRGKDSKLSCIDAVLRPSLRDFTTAKVADLVEYVFDELPADALESFRLRLETSASKAELARVAAAAARQTRLSSLDLAGETTALAAPAPAPRVKDVRAATAKAVVANARADFERAAEAIPSVTKALVALDFAKTSTVDAAVRAMGKMKKDLRAAEVAYTVLALPSVVDKSARSGQRAVQTAAINLLVALEPTGSAKRITALFDLENGPHAALMNQLEMVPAAELGEVFDWFEQRRGSKHRPPAHSTYYAIIHLATTKGTAATRADLQRRLRADRKLMKFVRYAYQTAARNLAAK